MSFFSPHDPDIRRFLQLGNPYLLYAARPQGSEHDVPDMTKDYLRYLTREIPHISLVPRVLAILKQLQFEAQSGDDAVRKEPTRPYPHLHLTVLAALAAHARYELVEDRDDTGEEDEDEEIGGGGRQKKKKHYSDHRILPYWTNSSAFLHYVASYISIDFEEEDGRKRRCFSLSFERKIRLWYTGIISEKLLEDRGSPNVKNEEKKARRIDSPAEVCARIADCFATQRLAIPGAGSWSHQDVVKAAHVPGGLGSALSAFVYAQFRPLSEVIDAFRKASTRNKPEERQDLNEQQQQIVDDIVAELGAIDVAPGVLGDVQAQQEQKQKDKLTQHERYYAYWKDEDREANEAALAVFEAIHAVKHSDSAAAVCTAIDGCGYIRKAHVPLKWLDDEEVILSLIRRIPLDELLPWLVTLDGRKRLTGRVEKAVLEQLDGECGVTVEKLVQIHRRFIIGRCHSIKHQPLDARVFNERVAKALLEKTLVGLLKKTSPLPPKTTFFFVPPSLDATAPLFNRSSVRVCDAYACLAAHAAAAGAVVYCGTEKLASGSYSDILADMCAKTKTSKQPSIDDILNAVPKQGTTVLVMDQVDRDRQQQLYSALVLKLNAELETGRIAVVHATPTFDLQLAVQAQSHCGDRLLTVLGFDEHVFGVLRDYAEGLL